MLCCAMLSPADTVMMSWPIGTGLPWDSMPGAFLMLLESSRKEA